MKIVVRSVFLYVVVLMLFASCEQGVEKDEYVAPYYKMGASIEKVDKYMKSHVGRFEKECAQDNEGDDCYQYLQAVTYIPYFTDMGVVESWDYSFTEKGLVVASVYISEEKMKLFDYKKELKAFRPVDESVDSGVVEGDIFTELYVDKEEKVVAIYEKGDNYVSVTYYERAFFECVEGCHYSEALQ